MPIHIKGSGGMSLKFAEMTKDMFSLNGGKLVITFPDDISVSNVISFVVVGAFDESSADFIICCISNEVGDKCIDWLGTSRTDSFNGGGSLVVDESQNSLTTKIATWDDWWLGTSSDLILDDGYYCYT